MALAEGKTTAEAKEIAGYARTTAMSTIFRGRTWQLCIRSLLDKHGLTDARIARALGASLKAKETKLLKASTTKTETGETYEYTSRRVPAHAVRLRAAETLADMRGMRTDPAAGQAEEAKAGQVVAIQFNVRAGGDPAPAGPTPSGVTAGFALTVHPTTGTGAAHG